MIIPVPPIECLRNGNVTVWNGWRRGRSRIDLHGLSLAGADLEGVDLSDADLTGCDLSEGIFRAASFAGSALRHGDLSGTEFTRCDWSEADLSETLAVSAKFLGCTFYGTDLSSATLHRSGFLGSHFSRVVLRDADLTECDLGRCLITGADLTGSRLADCSVYGIASWDLTGDPAVSRNLRITDETANSVTVDDLRIAQFVHLLLDNRTVRAAIHQLTTKVVLVLGRFNAERKPLLDALRTGLAERDLVPIMFDFQRPATRSFRETVLLLAGISHAVVADLTDALEVRVELSHIAADVPSVPVLALLHQDEPLYVTYDDLTSYPGISAPLRYESADDALRMVTTRLSRP